VHNGSVMGRVGGSMEESGVTLWGVLLGLATVLAVAAATAVGVFLDASRRGTTRWAAGWALATGLFAPAGMPLYVWRVYHAPEADGRVILPWVRSLMYLVATVWVVLIPTALVGLVIGLLGVVDERVLKMPMVWMAVQSLILGSVVIAWTYAFRTFVDRRPPASLGTPLNLRDAVVGQGIGVVLGATAVGVAVGGLAVSGYAHISWDPSSATAIPLLTLAVPLYIAAFMEEIVMRGYVQRTVYAAWGHIPAVLLSALPFALLHAGNPNLSLLGLLNIALIGVFFALTVIRTGTLWFAAGFHVAWNLTLGTVLTVPVSGIEMPGLFRTSLHGPTWLTGGAFGIEASAAATALFALLIAAVALSCARGSRFRELPDEDAARPAGQLAREPM